MKLSNSFSGLAQNQEILFILLYNLATLVSYHMGDLDPMYVLWAYFLQSLYIGLRYWVLEWIFQFRTKKWRLFLPFFFAIHYGGFHAGYIVFLLFMSRGSDLQALAKLMKVNFFILIGQFILFLLNELSMRTPYHKAPAFFGPYIRIVPMHIIIILGIKVTDGGLGTFDLFIVLKVLSDVAGFYIFDKKTTQ